MNDKLHQNLKQQKKLNEEHHLQNKEKYLKRRRG